MSVFFLAYISSGGSLLVNATEKKCKITGIYMLYVNFCYFLSMFHVRKLIYLLILNLTELEPLLLFHKCFINVLLTTTICQVK